ncbi:unnamed protein product [Toxocara canis]|uniref:PINc domain-containing protein n=1 Tax=Toxocara canis TaxID=6265 RepID=A0A183U3M8_TOXCA|nr:unnamed protein product [Toxocara canis]
MQDNAGRRRRIITLLERPTRNDNLLAHATPSLVAIAPQSIFVRASEKGAAEDRVTLMKVAEQMFEKRDQEMMTVEPQTAREATACLLNMETARETKETTARLPEPETAKETEEATACLLNMETARETKETTSRLPGPETAKETEEATACLIEPETARETEETTACLPDAEAYQQFCRTWKDLRVPTGAKAPNAVSLLSNTAKSPPSIGVTTARSGKFSDEAHTPPSRPFNKIEPQKKPSVQEDKKAHQKRSRVSTKKRRSKKKQKSREKTKRQHIHKYSSKEKKMINESGDLGTAFERTADVHEAQLPSREIPDVRIRTNKEICEDELGNPITIPLEELNRMELITEERLQEQEDEKAKEETKKMVTNMEVVQTEEKKLPQQNKVIIAEVTINELKRIVKMELKEEEVLLEHTQGEENDVVTDKTISEKSEEEMTAGLDEASAESAADNEPGFNTCRSMKAKSWNDQQRENCLLDAMMRAMETFHIQNVNSSAPTNDH